MDEHLRLFCDQWTVPLLGTAPPFMIQLSTSKSRDPCCRCKKKPSTIRQSQLVVFRDYVGTGLTLSCVGPGTCCHYERAPTYAYVMGRMCGQCEDEMVELVSSLNYERIFHIEHESFMRLLPPLVDIVNAYLQLDELSLLG